MLLLAAIGWYATWAWRFYHGHPTISHDYIAQWNKPTLATPVDQRAWPVYRRAYLRVHPDAPRLDAKPGDADWNQVVAQVRAHADDLEMVRHAAQRPILGFIYGYPPDPALDRSKVIDASQAGEAPTVAPPNSSDTMLMDVPATQYGAIRELARWIVADARDAAGTDDTRFVRDVETLVGMGDQAWGAATLIEQLVSASICSMALDATLLGLNAHPVRLSDRELADAAHALGAYRGGKIRATFDTERELFYDIIQRTYSDDGSGNGRLCAGGLRRITDLSGSGSPSHGSNPLGPIVAAVMAPRKEMIERYDEVMDVAQREADMPLSKRRAGVFEEKVDSLVGSMLGRLRYLPIGLFAPAVNRATFILDRVAQRRDGVLVAIALERYRMAHGAYPATLDALVPGLLPAVPPDRFDGGAIKYRLTEAGPIVYSVGVDGDDDGGRPPVDRDGAPANKVAADWTEYQKKKPLREVDKGRFDGDWVLWPPQDDR